jgi:hypothetical protein
MIRAILILITLCGPSIAVAQAHPEGLYNKPGLTCDPGMIGKSGGPVLINRVELEMPGLTCKFQGRTSISRMDAELVDATCKISGKPIQTRFFINKNDSGIALFSRELGVFLFNVCR